MSKLSKLALVLSAITVSAAANAGIVSNWVAADGTPWRAASGECWRSGFWTPATAAPGCDGAIAPVAPKVEEKKAAPAPAPEPGPVVEYEQPLHHLTSHQASSQGCSGTSASSQGCSGTGGRACQDHLRC